MNGRGVGSDGAGPGDCGRAYVRTGALEIAYLRHGRGVPVLLFDDDGTAHDGLRNALAEYFRVIAPELPADWNGIDSLTWICELIDGLGLIEVRLVATGQRAFDALEFAASEPHRIERLAIVNSNLGRANDIETTLGRSGTRLLLSRISHSGRFPRSPGRDALLRFLAQEADNGRPTTIPLQFR